MKVSGLVILSQPENLCYPYLESIRSFLPVVDEMVIVMDILNEDGSREKVEELGEKIRIVSSAFDLENWGWISYGIMRTTGYQACKGDIVMMFDADGILHENEQEKLRDGLKNLFMTPNHVSYYWTKYRFYKPTVYYNQNKHSGIYKKSVLGDRFDFFGKHLGTPNKGRYHKGEIDKQLDVTLFGYEHLWDTEEVIKGKVTRYGQMKDRRFGQEFKTPEEYYRIYIEDLLKKLEEGTKGMPISEHPAIIQDKLRGINEKHFGFNFFR